MMNAKETQQLVEANAMLREALRHLRDLTAFGEFHGEHGAAAKADAKRFTSSEEALRFGRAHGF